MGKDGSVGNGRTLTYLVSPFRCFCLSLHVFQLSCDGGVCIFFTMLFFSLKIRSRILQLVQFSNINVINIKILWALFSQSAKSSKDIRARWRVFEDGKKIVLLICLVLPFSGTSKLRIAFKLNHLGSNLMKAVMFTENYCNTVVVLDSLCSL